jgi:hypothetical protein
MISIRSVGLVIDTVVYLTLDKWETVSGQFGGYLRMTTHSRCPTARIVSLPRFGLELAVGMELDIGEI